MRRALPTVLHLAAISVVITLCFAAGTGLPLPEAAARPAGLGLVVAGAGLMAWVVSRLGPAVLGLAEPRGRTLVTSGPYRFLRHPLYTGIAVALLGVVLWTRSAAGLGALLALLIPAQIHRARSEERALGERFGEAWSSYASRTGFLVPLPRRRSS